MNMIDRRMLLSIGMALACAGCGHSAPPPSAGEYGEKPAAGAAEKTDDGAPGEADKRTASGADSGFVLDPAQQQRLGIAIAQAEAMHYAAEAEASAVALDLTPLLALNADLAANEAALTASSANYRRTESLHADRDNASAQALEAARAQYLSDRAHHDALAQQMRLSAGSSISALPSGPRQALFARLGRGDAVLLRADFLPGTSLAAVSQVSVIANDGDEPMLHGRVFGRAASANPQRPGPSLLVLVESPDWLQAGRSVRVSAASAKAGSDGVRLPIAAVLHREGGLWAYVQTARDHFERRHLGGAVSLQDGVFVASGIRAGERVVVRGAASLLAAELAPPAGGAAGEED